MKIKLILIYARNTDYFSYYDDWIDAFKCEEFDLHLINIIDPKEYNKDNLKKIQNSELTILHHSVLADNLKYIDKYKPALIARTGKLFSFVGNEVNLPVLGLKPKIDFLKQVQPEYIFTQLLQEAGDWLYSDCSFSKVLSVPHALNPNKFKSEKTISDRSIDIGNRSTRYGTYLGDNDRNRIVDYFKTIAKEKNLMIDLCGKENKRFNRDDWATFLNNCKSTITTEAGSFYLEKNDHTLNEIIKYISSKKFSFFVSSKNIPDKNSILHKLFSNFLPNSIQNNIKSYVCKNLILENNLEDENINFDEIWQKFFKDKSKTPVYTKCISSRHFDAIGTKTLQIAFPGRFNDILIPNEHYVVLEPDFSNIDNIILLIKNTKYREEIVNNVYEYICTKHTYSNRLNTILTLI